MFGLINKLYHNNSKTFYFKFQFLTFFTLFGNFVRIKSRKWRFLYKNPDFLKDVAGKYKGIFF